MRSSGQPGSAGAPRPTKPAFFIRAFMVGAPMRRSGLWLGLHGPAGFQYLYPRAGLERTQQDTTSWGWGYQAGGSQGWTWADRQLYSCMVIVEIQGSCHLPIITLSIPTFIQLLDHVGGVSSGFTPAEFYLLGASCAVYPPELALKLRIALCDLLLLELGAGGSAPGFHFRQT